MQVQLDNLVQQVKDLTELLAFNGLNLVSQENIRQLEMYLQHASQLQAYRLATSLRYLNVELKRFMDHHPAFNAERYVFFLNNCWLWSVAHSSKRSPEGNFDRSSMSDLLGKPSEPVDIDSMEFHLGGLEKVHLEGALFGLIFHLFPPIDEKRLSIAKLSIMQPPKGLPNPEALLGLSFPGTDPQVAFSKLLKNKFVLEKMKYLEKESTIQMAPVPPRLVYRENDKDEPFHVDRFSKYDLEPSVLLDQVSSTRITPFDIIIMAGYLYVKNVQIVSRHKEGEEQEHYQTIMHTFTVSHERGYPLHIRIQDKQVNVGLIENLSRLMEAQEQLKGMFGKLTLERGKLTIFPLAIVEDRKDGPGVWFPCMAKDYKVNNKEILQALYSNKKQVT